MKHARIQFIQTSTLEQPWNLPFLTDLENDGWNIETSSNIFKFSFFLLNHLICFNKLLFYNLKLITLQ